MAGASSIVAFALTIAFDRVASLALPEREALIFPPDSRFRMKTTEFDFQANVNSLGFRDRPFRTGTPPVIRVLAIGDSFTYGWGVQDSEAWPKVLERDLWQRGMAVEIANLGRPGAGPDQYLEIAEAAVPLLEPQWIIIGLLQGDDLNQSKPRPDERHANRQPVLSSLYPALSQLSASMSSEGPLVVTAEQTKEKWRQQAQELLRHLKPEQRQRFDALDAATRERFLGGDMNPDIIAVAIRQPQYSSWLLDESGSAVQRKVAAMADRLARIRELAEAHGARLLVVSIPNWPYVWHSQSLRNLGFVLKGEMLSTDAPDEEALQACRQAGIERYVSVTDEIRRRSAEGDPLYFPLDGHFTREGQWAFAQALAPRVGQILSDEGA